jgi:heptosyltransferase-3
MQGSRAPSGIMTREFSMRLLFIKPKHIGDTLLLMPTLIAVRQAYPAAEIWLLVRRGCESILAGRREIDRLLLLAGVEKHERTVGDFVRQAGILATLACTRFDYVFELGDGHRGRLFARAARTGRRYSVKPSAPLRAGERRAFTGVSTFDWQTCHRVEKDYRTVAEFLPLPAEIPPLRFDPAQTRPWPPGDKLRDFAVMQIGTRQGFNRWTLENWLAVCAHLLTRVDSVVIGAGSAPDELEKADALQAAFGERVVCTRGGADWSQMAGLFYRTRLYVGPATAALHLAAACGCPLVVLFGATIEEHWHPWQVPYRAVNIVDTSKIADPEERYRLVKAHTMQDTPLAAVIAACDAALAGSLR